MIVVRHAKSVVDATTPAADWELAHDAHAAAARLGEHLTGHTVVASTERKAIDTAVALDLGAVATSAAFCEVERPWYDGPDELARHVAPWFDGEAVAGWEPLPDAVARFERGVCDLEQDGLVVVTHGTVMTAWLAARGLVSDPVAFWSELRMPDAFEVGPTLMRCPAE